MFGPKNCRHQEVQLPKTVGQGCVASSVSGTSQSLPAVPGRLGPSTPLGHWPLFVQWEMEKGTMWKSGSFHRLVAIICHSAPRTESHLRQEWEILRTWMWGGTWQTLWWIGPKMCIENPSQHRTGIRGIPVMGMAALVAPPRGDLGPNLVNAKEN